MLETIAVMIVVGVSTLSGLVVGYVMGSSDSRRKRPEPRPTPSYLVEQAFREGWNAAKKSYSSNFSYHVSPEAIKILEAARSGSLDS